ncbi:hypothetical protein [Luteibacter sp. UNCMF366Tsu5.1]|uniref:hypothetical protein n=1 Tax=Luteibacter sp. UNCMF366Tsu5.1 TaxID=1502758 RepID=UPI001160DC54|nr:hypothetical protein [Luteibacter sp. UNCMF366Tsu5.1]
MRDFISEARHTTTMESEEKGASSHGGSREDAPRRIQDCALKNGFNGADATEPEHHFAQSGPPDWLYPVILVGAAAYALLNAVNP